ncbi:MULTISPECIES: phosphomannomutase [Mesorhizobium]|uniref:Phosphomannomutase n=1 Tax=Rhizobium loti TaxID=381 RepID=A0A6M7U923_RHILI|nr:MULTISPECIES: phosphomannomutase [Mesorhizobium]KRB32095.1 phosphomannomutase [Mesorhizobium sp. Root172]OBQ71866.1 phosphomannomutase [Mesorhizobium loti]QKC72553.1 phosphomannomutase [Mesorhizobium loti]
MKFGSSGLRGLASELVGKPSGLYTEAFAWRLAAGGCQPKARVLVGRDLRDSSPTIAANCMAALAASGLQPIDCGAIPTPALALYGLQHGMAALMVTGSHIPADRNGIKFYSPHGEISKADEAAIAQYAAEKSDSYRSPPSAETALPTHHDEAMAAYRARAEDILKPGSLSGLRIGVYQHSSVAADLLVEILRSFGASVTPVGKSDTFVPVDTEAVSPTTIAKFRAWTREFKLDAIVSTDADADRPLVTDENGDLFRGDLIGLAVALYLRADVVVTPVTSNSGISKTFGFEVLRTKVGSPFVIEAMEASYRTGGIVLGFEANGGVLLGSDCSLHGRTLTALPTRDAMLPILAVLGTVASTGKKVSHLRELWKLPVCASERLENFPVESSSGLMLRLADREQLQRFLAPFGTVAEVDETDGLRTRMANGEIIHLRPSGNAPELRCYSEAANQDRAEAIVALTLERARAITSTDETEVV